MCENMRVLMFAAVLWPCILPALWYRRDLIARGDASGLLPVWHPRLLVGGMVWAFRIAAPWELGDSSRRIYRSGKMQEVEPKALRVWRRLVPVLVWIGATFASASGVSLLAKSLCRS